MKFSEIEYLPQQSDFLTYLKSIGVVLETVILKPGDVVANIYETSRLAALTGMEILADRYKLEFQRLNPQLNFQDYFNIKIFSDKELIGIPVDFNQFIGLGYNLANHKLTLYVKATNYYGMFATTTEGFAYALIETPHGIRYQKGKKPKHMSQLDHDILSIGELIKSYLKVVLAVENITDTEHLSIISWSTDWSNYFDAGKELWGEFCWTTYNPKENTITFIAASTTD